HRIAGGAAAADAHAGREWIGSGIIGNCRPRRQLEPKHVGTLASEPFGLHQQPFSVRRRLGVREIVLPAWRHERGSEAPASRSLGIVRCRIPLRYPEAVRILIGDARGVLGIPVDKTLLSSRVM